MKKCKHKNANATWAGRRVWRMGGGGRMSWFIGASWEQPDSIVCPDCGTWLPLGPANEEDDAVKVEMHAAGLATDMAIGVGVGGHRPDQIVLGHCWHWWSEEDCDETCCYCGYTFPTPPDAHDTCPVALLARAIHEHEEG